MSPPPDVEALLRLLFSSLADRLAGQRQAELADLVGLHGEYALALEFAADWISEDELALSDRERTEMIALATQLKTDRVAHAIADLPTKAAPA
jgi:hypothetical protein